MGDNDLKGVSQVYPVHEMFHTFQGEGVHMGKLAFFVRLFGCPVKCPWCDSAGTWHPDYVPKDITRMSPDSIVEQAVASGARILVVTGGEPAIHDLRNLANAAHAEGLLVHLETSGGFPIKGYIDWITLSPKKWKLPLAENVKVANEFKFIIETAEDIKFYFEMIKELGYDPQDPLNEDEVPIWLHPEWGQSKNGGTLGAICKAVKEQGPQGTFRAGWQLHKLYDIDRMDSRSRKLVPLGGDPKRGY